MENVINTLHLSGKVVGTPVVGHEAFGEKFYYLTLGVPRLSGAQDLLPVTLSERLAVQPENRHLQRQLTPTAMR